MAGQLYADYAGMDGTASRVRAIARDVAAQERPARSGADAAEAAAGEFAAQLSPGADAFATSWAAALEIYSECGELVADNVGSSVVALTEADGTLAAAQPPPFRLVGGHPVPE